MHTAAAVPLRVVFRALAREAETLMEFSAKLDNTISAAHYCDSETMQSVDRMMQYAGALQALCMALSESQRADVVIDVTSAVRQIRLDDVVSRVTHSLGVAERGQRPASGDVDLF